MIYTFLRRLDNPIVDEEECNNEYKLDVPEEMMVYAFGGVRFAANALGFGDWFTPEQLKTGSVELCKLPYNKLVE